MTKALIAAVCLMFAGAFAGTASAQDIFVKFAGMPGSSSMKDRGDWIQASTFTEGVAVTAANSTVMMRSGKAAFERITLTKALDAATIQLREAAASGRIIPKVDIEVQQSAGKMMTYYKVTLTGVYVQSVSTSIQDGSSSVGEEAISLGFEEIRWEFTPIDPKDGKPKDKVIGGWNVPQNRKL